MLLCFFAEGIYIQSIDMEDVFQWDDFMALGAVKRLQLFIFAQQLQNVENFSNNIILV